MISLIITQRAIMKRAVLYLRVSTIDQTTANQERELREIAETERQIMADSPDPSVRLRALVRAYIHFATSNPAYFRIMFDSGFATACVARAMLRDCAVASRRAVDHGHDVFHQAFH
jgi:hypothetical protein